ncbi:DASS family sodium-coupled anion symporter [candidate division KSB1 bacterium]|nr:DASS family sodium-coupled anion symporter [candidate division KSB1 bacterium]
MTIRHKIGFWLGLPIFFSILFLPFPESLPVAGQRTLAVAALMACWWITEAIPIPATALLPIVLFPILKVSKVSSVTACYGDSNIFLFMGGFMLAMTMQHWNLHKRIALHVVKGVGISPNRLVLGFMIATALLSMWISNTATTMMMYPIALAIVLQYNEFSNGKMGEHELNNFRTVLMLCIAYAASIGGIGTLIGTPPNIIFAASLKKLFPEAPEIGFLQWMMVGIPLVIIMIPLTWLLLTKLVYCIKIKTEETATDDSLKRQIAGLGKISKAEKLTFAIFIFTAAGWIFRKNIVIGSLTIPGWSDVLGIASYVNDATVAILAAVLLFITPVDLNKGTFLLNWKTASQIPWGILILFGGGIALAGGFKDSGLAHWIGSQLHLFGNINQVFIVMITAAVLIFLTEVTSNTATATIFMPVLAAAAITIHIHPFMLMIPATMAASCAFMLPVATPPNAIVFGSGHITVPQMAKAGFGLNLLGILIITLITYLIAVPVFGIAFHSFPAWIN